MSWTRIAVVIAVVAIGCKKDKPSESGEEIAEPREAADEATPMPAPKDQKGSVPIGERIEVAKIPKLAERLPKVKAADPKESLDARYQRALERLGSGKHREAIAILHQVLTDQRCNDEACVKRVLEITGKSSNWSGVFNEPLFQDVITAWE
ncbi:MAG: hypothetical protein KJO07_20565, partial [Deltaproteobacteria bacterium]|nr:hypothetical protein [Deltaproteobacteria bacterium]